MHNLKVLAFGSKNFNTSLEELKEHLNFKLITDNNNEFMDEKLNKFEILLIHEDYFQDNLIKKKANLINVDKIKILIFSKKNTNLNFFSEKISLPLSVKNLNKIIENSIVKKSFNKNSSIKIKNYILDKNEKKLKNDKTYVLLTEKEVQLLELFLVNNKPVSKDMILKHVWKYAADSDTHTVETHIYRLRKKIKSSFTDEKFILNHKDGYVL